MIHRNAAVGPFEANCHVLADEDTGEAIVLDPGSEPETVLKLADGLQVQTVLLTHGHIDHVSAVRDVVEATGAKVMLHRADRGLYERLELQCASLSARLGIDLGPIHDPPPVDTFIGDGDRIAFGRHELKVLHTPGHTPGSCCFLGDGILFSGDTLFQRGVGRTDLPGGHTALLLQTILERLYPLDPGVVVYPGHGGATTIGEEKRENPFVRGG
jgi:glyoxylase-like metal-dependent hydrolase (beta-lactamase superfamily II)